MRRMIWLALAMLCAVSVDPVRAGTDTRWLVNNPRTKGEHSMAWAVKALCSGHFITRRPLAKLIEEVVEPQKSFPQEAWQQALRNVEISERTGIVTLSLPPFRVRARYFGDQGCVLLPDGHDEAFFEPKKVKRPASSLPGTPRWPDGGLAATGKLLGGYNSAQFQKAATAALDPAIHGTAILVVHRGDLVFEQYAPGFTKDMPTNNWSMGKSLIGTLIGRLVQLGAVKLNDPASISEWHSVKGDPRSQITPMHLMQMSSGLWCPNDNPDVDLEWNRPWNWVGETAEHMRIYAEPLDVIRHAIYRPMQAAPGVQPQYSNCDMQALGYVIRASIRARNEDYLSWPYRNLYDKLGMTGMVSEVDTYGNFHLSGYDFGTARDWAKLGLLYLADGMWKGERLLPQGWTKLVSTPAESWNTHYPPPRAYGATFWLNTRGWIPALPADAFWPQGAGGNYAFIVPSRDLVIVILRNRNGESALKHDRAREALAHVMQALPKESAAP